MSRNKQRSKRQAKAPENSNHSSHAESSGSSSSSSSSNNPSPASTKSALLFIYTETPLHVGCGEGLGSIDLPIQRERMSGLPIAPGSGLKGALREVFRKHADELALFGPAPPEKGESQAPTHAGALSLTDARLLLLPIRTVYGGWAWATCPMILERLARDLEIAGHARPRWADLEALQSLNTPQGPNQNPQALTFDDAPIIAPDGNNLLLEDTLYSVRRASKEIAAELVRELQAALPDQGSYNPLRRRLAKQLVVLSDAELKHWAKHGTEIVTRVRIDDESGTVANGALWNEEALPSESLLWSLALVSPSRKPSKDRKPDENSEAHDLLTSLKKDLNTRIFLGGDRTIGRGLCGLNLREAT